jgi:hypothetical protein
MPIRSFKRCRNRALQSKSMTPLADFARSVCRVTHISTTQDHKEQHNLDEEPCPTASLLPGRIILAAAALAPALSASRAYWPR